MSKIEKRVQVDETIGRLFSYVPEATLSREMWPGLLEVGEVQRLPLGGVLARWLYRMAGTIFDDQTDRREPLVDREGTAPQLGDIVCGMKWNFHSNVATPQVTLGSDYIYWAQN
jgi:hypothetical protein